MELLRDGSPGSSAEVCVSNNSHTDAHTLSPLPCHDKEVYIALYRENTSVNVMTLCLNRHRDIAKHMSGNITGCYSLHMASSEHPLFTLKPHMANLHQDNCQANQLISHVPASECILFTNTKQISLLEVNVGVLNPVGQWNCSHSSPIIMRDERCDLKGNSIIFPRSGHRVQRLDFSHWSDAWSQASKAASQTECTTSSDADVLIKQTGMELSKYD